MDVPRPLKRSGKFNAYLEFEAQMQSAICKRFNLPEKEPPSVKHADQLMLAAEARDLMSPIRPDWDYDVEPVPFIVIPWDQQRSKDSFMKRFCELTNNSQGYEDYLGRLI